MDLNFENLAMALSIKEKILALKDSEVPGGLNTEEIIEEWINLKSLVSREDFEKRLEIEEINREEFARAIVATTNEDDQILIEYVKKCDWFSQFEDIILLFKENDRKIQASEKFIIDESFVIRPYLYYFEKELRQRIVEIQSFKISENAVNQLIISAMSKVYNIYSKVLVLKLQDYKEKYSLEGESGEKKFIDFLKNSFSEEEALEFYLDHPVLTRSATTTIQNLLQFLVKSLLHLDREHQHLKELYQADLDVLCEINVSAGDTHEKGKTVLIFQFNNNKKMIYKPRDLRIINAYNKFLDWVNKKSRLLEMKSLQGIYQEDYAFEMFVENKSCNSNEEIANYYIRFGQLIAIAYILSANDLHLENLIANGEYPILIDLETILQGKIPYQSNEKGGIAELAINLYLESVKSTALLPMLAFTNNKEGKGIDLSALGGKEVELPFKILLPVYSGTDEFKFEYQNYVRPGSHNLPRLREVIVTFEDYRNEILTGFEKMMTFFLEEKDNLKGENSIFNAFKGFKVRNVLKNTETYVNLLSYINHPNYAKNMLKKEKLIENIWSYPHKNKLIIKFEYEDMMIDDIPVFFSIADEKNLISSNSNEVNHFLVKSGYENVLDRINLLNDEEIQKQSSIIKVALGFCEEQSIELQETRSYHLNLNVDYDLLVEAKKIGDFLLEKSIILDHGSGLAFVDAVRNKANPGAWEISPIGHDLNEGLSGIAFFFFELYYLTKEEKYFLAYEKAMKSAITTAAFDKEWNSFEGKASIVFPVLNEIYKTGGSKFRVQCIEILDQIDENKTELTSKEWLSGMSGLIPLLIDASDLLEEKRYLDLAIEFSEIVINSNLSQKIGLSDGLSGIILGIFRTYEKVGNEKYLKFIKEMMMIENQLIRNEKETSYTWYKGLVGVAATRLRMKKLLQQEDLNLIKETVEAVIQQMKKDDSLCDGNIGDIEFLLHCQELDPNISIEIDKKLSDIFQSYCIQGHYGIKQLPGFTSVPLFTGLSGIGYGLLRALKPKKVSHVLTYQLLK